MTRKGRIGLDYTTLGDNSIELLISLVRDAMPAMDTAIAKELDVLCELMKVNSMVTLHLGGYDAGVEEDTGT